METNALGAVTRNYALLGEEGNHSDKSRVSSSRMDLKVSVVRKVNTEKTNTWFPKKVLIVTDKRRIKSMAWAHSSSSSDTLLCSYSLLFPFNASIADDLITCPSSSEITYPIENDSRSELTMDSDPSLSSINAPSWYSSQSSTSPSTSSASTTTGFQLNSISIEPDIESGSLRSSNPPLDPSRNEEGGKGCTSILKNRTALRKHAKVHATKSFSCQRCGRTFAEKTKLNRHMLSHTGERAFQCQFSGCSKAFSLEANLKSHIKTHTGEKPHKCKICDHAFSHPYNLRVHISRRHKEQSLT
ncbi:unnamed protein product [Nippostrongylus brasiliensis]|uniref:LD31045p (inferred by orthology to a D. melanogaster protein) n=1 Tax=Nippostrongylus brasiliensis TaxID=27835 RepID=A0A0N4YQX3_NIPBR|nr:unnamed protein product [Nippostrongylus brasiliensis]